MRSAARSSASPPVVAIGGASSPPAQTAVSTTPAVPMHDVGERARRARLERRWWSASRPGVISSASRRSATGSRARGEQPQRGHVAGQPVVQRRFGPDGRLPRDSRATMPAARPARRSVSARCWAISASTGARPAMPAYSESRSPAGTVSGVLARRRTPRPAATVRRPRAPGPAPTTRPPRPVPVPSLAPPDQATATGAARSGARSQRSVAHLSRRSRRCASAASVRPHLGDGPATGRSASPGASASSTAQVLVSSSPVDVAVVAPARHRRQAEVGDDRAEPHQRTPRRPRPVAGHLAPGPRHARRLHSSAAERLAVADRRRRTRGARARRARCRTAVCSPARHASTWGAARTVASRAPST